MAVLAGYAVPHPPLIVPGVGKGEEQGIARTIAAYREVARRVAAHRPDTIILSSPHAPAYYDAFAICGREELPASMRRFRDYKDDFTAPVDTALVHEAVARAEAAGLPLMERAWREADMDHAAFVPLYFVNRRYTGYKLVEVGLSGLSAEDHRKLGQMLAQAAGALGRRCVYIASGDLSHKLKDDGPYGFAPEGPVLDRAICDAFAANDLEALFAISPELSKRGADCGLDSFRMMAGALDSTRHSGELLSYEGPFGVGYGVAAFEVQGASDAQEVSGAPGAAAPEDEGEGE